jgi:hypothetical protein
MSDFHFVPAATGFYALWQTDFAPGYGRTIITGWQIDTVITHVNYTRALIEGDNTMNVEAILCPDGSVQQVDGGVFWRDVAHWLADVPDARKAPPPPPADRFVVLA